MNNNEIKTYRLIIKGKVQNVGFRHWFSDLAISLGLNGYVQNKESKDEVEAIIQGNMQSILSITEKSKTGPASRAWPGLGAYPKIDRKFRICKCIVFYGFD